jgi:hypothetical protein
MTRLLNLPKMHGRLLRLWVFGMLVALLLSQSLGQLHAVKHPGLNGTKEVANVHALHDHAGFLDQLFSSHSSDKDCRLYDQLGDGHAMPGVAAVVLPVVMPSLLVAIFAGQALARWAALFDARGPPLTF